MKLCIITNYTRGYINDTQIFNKLLETLGLSSKDIFHIQDTNSVYSVNDKYTHSLILLDFKSTSMLPHKQYLSEITIPRVFIVDTLPKVHKDLDITFNKELRNSSISTLNCLPYTSQLFLYEQYADGLVFYSNIDRDNFSLLYPLKTQIPTVIIPPSLGDKKDIKINFTHFQPNNNIGFNGVPSFSNGIFNLLNALNSFPYHNVSLFGDHGRNDISNEILVNHATQSNPNIKFMGKLKDTTKFFKENHIYYNVSIYDSFNYFTFTSLLNGMVPILSKSTTTTEYFPSYPFITDFDEDSINNTLKLIKSTSIEDLKKILSNTVALMTPLNNQDLKIKYKNFLNIL
jgi:hypothetical protein